MESAGLAGADASATTGVGRQSTGWMGRGALVLPQQVLASYRLPAGGTVQGGTGCAPSRWSCGPARRGGHRFPRGIAPCPFGGVGPHGNAAGPLLAGAAALPPDAVSGRQGPPIKKGPRRGPLWFCQAWGAFKKFSRGERSTPSLCASRNWSSFFPMTATPPGAVAFQVDGQNGVVDRQPQQEPALALPLGEGHPDTLPVVRGDGPVFALGRRPPGRR